MSVTEKGWVYFVQCYPEYLKVGFTAESVYKRIARIRGGASSHPRGADIATPELVGVIDGTMADETSWHRKLAPWRAHRASDEWFILTPEVRQLIADVPYPDGLRFERENIQRSKPMMRFIVRGESALALPSERGDTSLPEDCQESTWGKEWILVRAKRDDEAIGIRDQYEMRLLAGGKEKRFPYALTRKEFGVPWIDYG